MFPLMDTVPRKNFPLVNWTIIALNAVVFLMELSLSQEELQYFIHFLGLVPARFSNPEWAAQAGYPMQGYWPFITNMFLHGGWMHFVGNMWTLYIFGDNVEDRLGRFGYLFFYLLCGLAASLLHFLLNLESTTPALGASGAISGVMGAYMLMFPKSRILFVIPLFFLPYFIELYAFFYIGAWFLIQLLSGGVILMASQSAGIAFWAHIGGFVMGFVITTLYKLLKSTHESSFEDEFLKKYQKFD